MLQKLILQEIQLLPEFAQMEVLNFLIFTKNKYLEKNNTTISEHMTHPSFGCGDVKIKILSDFDEPLEDFQEYM